jgi:hypothetical protein
MKTLSILIAMSLASITDVFAQTNKFYVTEEVHVRHFSPTSEQIEQAKLAKDSRPAEDDLEGNWGQVCEGFQLSIRFSKDSFTNNEPINASILLRNVSDKPLTYYAFYPKDIEMWFVVHKGQEQLHGKDEITPKMTIIEMLNHLNNGSRDFPVLPVGVQRRFKVNLNDYFDLTTNGQYTVQVTRRIKKLDKSGETNVVSGYAVLRIKR